MVSIVTAMISAGRKGRGGIFPTSISKSLLYPPISAQSEGKDLVKINHFQ